ncbi:MAG: hypothetical protein PHO32_02295 [Candidatus Cloacimonetes bacterium]|nr:hypothetical protein [Candidatus Cloacimonadota bacterium]
MQKVYVIILLLVMASALGAENSSDTPIKGAEEIVRWEFMPRLFLDSYTPIESNRIDIYKLDKGLNIYKARPYDIPALAPEYKEKVDFARQIILLSVKVGDYKIAVDVPISFDAYISNMQKKAFRKSLIANQKTQTQQTQVTTGGLLGELVLEIPAIALPRAVQKVLGTSAPKLNLDGTQKISLSASSTKRKIVPIYETENKSTFDLKMQQETNLRLSGTIGDKISMNLKYNSKQDEQIFDANNVNVKYTGNEDELIKSIEAGNISLALSGSRYISYSASSQGLFGITSKFKYGDLDLSVIASKEESQKSTQTYTGKSQADSSTVSSWRYAPRTMYYLSNPYDLYPLYTAADVAREQKPAEWVGNAIKTGANGDWQVHDVLLPKSGTVRLFMDDGDPNNNVGTFTGDQVFYTENYHPPYYPEYVELIEGTDFITNYDLGTVNVLKTVDRLSTLSVIYTTKGEMQVPPLTPEQMVDGKTHTFVIRRANQVYEPYTGEDNSLNCWHFQMRNIYDMNRTNIKSDGFNLQVYTVNVDLTRNYNLPDNIATPEFIANTGFNSYNDYLRLDSNGDGIINGSDSTVNLSRGLVIMPYLEPFYPLGDSLVYRYENESEYSYNDQTSLFLAIKGKIGRDAIELSSGGILRGSVKVRVNGIEQKENSDYIVDYDFGRITFLSAAGKDPDAKIEIDFENRTLFDVAQKNLAGLRADWKLTDYAKMGGTLIYRSETVADKRPRIGNENIELWMGNVDAELTFKPGFITRWLDAMPMINTTAPSQVSVSGEVAFTLPNIYGDPSGKKDEAYLDDMESIIDSYPLGVTYATWSRGSKPFQTPYAKGRMNWYNPKNKVYREDIEDPLTLTEKERKETVTVLALKSTPSNIVVSGSEVRSWSGVMKYLGNELDISQKKYLEVLVRVETPTANPDITLHIDLGDINEDFYTEYGGLGKLNTEDKDPKDGILILEEDIGLDGIAKTLAGADLNDVAVPATDDDYSKVNGTEDNRVLDTEDLNNNGDLNTLDRYFSYPISLAEGANDLYTPVGAEDKGWRLYRIPLTDPAYYQMESSQSNSQPTLKKISYARLWLDSHEESSVYIADVSIVGNKWQDYFVRRFQYSYVVNTPSHNALVPNSELNNFNTGFLSGIVNNQKNSTHYASPPGTVYTENDRQSTEAALSLEVANLQKGQMCLLRQRLLDPYNLLSYSKLRFWVYPEAEPGNPDSLDIIVRFGADSLNYYQVRERVKVQNNQGLMTPSNWLQLEYVMQDVISLKQDSINVVTATIEAEPNKRWYSFRGTPTLTNIRELYVGVAHLDETAASEFSGTTYFNDVRVADPFEDIGVARRLSLNTVLADFSTLNVDYEEKDESFNTVIQRGRTNAFTRTQSLNMSNKYFLNKFFPNSWNLDIPVLLTRNYSLGIPRFRANSDLLRNNITNEQDKDREKTERLAYSADLGFSQKTAPKSKILQYTIYRLSLSSRIEKTYSYTSTAIDTILAYRGTVNYNLNIPSESTSIKIYKNYRFSYFPNTFSNSATFNANEPQSYDWLSRPDSLGVYYWDWRKRSQTSSIRAVTTDNNISWSILNDLSATARYNTKRDLKQKEYLYDINIGRMNEFVQDLGITFNPNYIPRLLSFTSSVGSRYSDTQRSYFQNNSEGQQEEVSQRDGNTNRTIRVNLTLQNSTLLSSWTEKLKNRKPKSDTKIESKENDSSAPPDPAATYSDEEQKKMEQLKEEEQKNYEQQLKEEDQKLREQMKKDEEQKKLESIQEEEAMRLLKEKEEAAKNEEERDEPKSQIEAEQPKTDSDIPGKETIAEIGEGDKPPTEKEEPKPKKPKGDPVAGFVGMLSRVKNITASYQNTYTMNYARRTNPYPFAFQIGLPIFSLEKDSLESISDDNTITVGSGITLSRKLDSVMNYSFTTNKRNSSASSQVIGYTFPDVTISLMDFESWVGMGKYLTSTRLNSGFQYTVRQNGSLNWVKPKQESFTTAFNPLLGFTGNIMKVVTANVSYSVSKTENITDMDNYKVVKSNDTQTMNANVSYSFRAGRGLTIPFTKKRIHIKNELTSSMGVAYEKNYDFTEGQSSSQVDRSTTRLAFTPTATYQFNQDIKGGLTSSYEVTADKKRDDGTKMFSLGIWVEVNL